MWSAMALIVNRVQEVAYRITREGTPFRWSLVMDTAISVRGKVSWDSGLYLAIANEGYVRGAEREAAFPGYALAIRCLTRLTHDDVVAAVLISAAGGLLATVAFWAWLRLHERPMGERLVALGLFVLYPYAFLMFGVAYSDSFLLAAALAALVLVERRHYLLGGLAGAVATLSRPNSLVLVPVLAVIALQGTGALSFAIAPRSWSWSPRQALRSSLAFWRGVRLDRTRINPRMGGALVAAVGVGAYSAWLTARYHDPFYFWTIQASYGHRPLTDPFLWLKANVFRQGGIINSPVDAVNEVISFVLLVGTAISAPSIGRRFGWGYALLIIGLVATTWATAQWFAPSGRYLLPVVPVVIAAAAPWLVRRRWLTAALMVLFGGASIGLAIGFAGAFDINW
jgi:hypothetical protein